MVLLVFLILAYAVATSAQGSTVADVPMLSRGPQPAVEVMINGQGPFLFAIDTGASLQADIDPALVSQLKLQTNGKVRAGDPSGQNAREFDTVLISSIGLGGAEFRNVTALTREPRTLPNFPKVDGTLGFSLFEQYLFTLDYSGKRVRLERGELAAANGSDILSFEMPHGIPVVELVIGNFKVKAHIDSGNIMGGFILPAALVEKLSLASSPVTVGRAHTVSNEIEIKEVRLRDTIKLGRFEFSQPTIAFPTFAEAVNIGSKILREFALTFDQKNKRIRLQRAIPTATAQTIQGVSRERNEYVGVYGTRSISFADGALFLQRQGGPKLKLVPLSKDEFTFQEVPDARIKFVRDETGRITELRVLNREGQWEISKKDRT
jgi:hypothetical protein